MRLLYAALCLSVVAVTHIEARSCTDPADANADDICSPNEAYECSGKPEILKLCTTCTVPSNGFELTHHVDHIYIEGGTFNMSLNYIFFKNGTGGPFLETEIWHDDTTLVYKVMTEFTPSPLETADTCPSLVNPIAQFFQSPTDAVMVGNVNLSFNNELLGGVLAESDRYTVYARLTDRHLDLKSRDFLDQDLGESFNFGVTSNPNKIKRPKGAPEPYRDPGSDFIIDGNTQNYTTKAPTAYPVVTPGTESPSISPIPGRTTPTDQPSNTSDVIKYVGLGTAGVVAGALTMIFVRTMSPRRTSDPSNLQAGLGALKSTPEGYDHTGDAHLENYKGGKSFRWSTDSSSPNRFAIGSLKFSKWKGTKNREVSAKSKKTLETIL